MLRQQDVGHRIVVRRIVGIREGRPLFTDALGDLIELSESHITLATDRGRLRVPIGEIHRARRVPAARRPTAGAVVALELAADEAWPAPVRGQLGDWLLRSADGWTGRANSALPVGDPDRPLAAAIDAVQRWYAERGQPAMVNTPLPLAAPVGAELDARGWAARPPVLVQAAPLAALPPAPAGRTDQPPVELAGAPSEDWLGIAAGRKGGLPDAARHVLTAVEQVRFASVHADGRLVAVGRGTVTGQGRWLGLTLIEVLPEARRQGLADRVIRALVDWARAEGATHAFLQVEQRNTPAVALYRGLGFTTHHTYLTRVAPV
ncbi:MULTISPECIES: GNAT family N-acetyltransferase [Micromonospora]|uniref:GNAT family N-acetyltransferase n=1 Tax=Micromonospora solifontis TaxID=2487138 RepID=A0ABX9WIE0_9ACTN|nr:MULTISPECIES: GNAT family N-acetyltransferase [Micromonospora]NES15342.1 GNAT family N-acetyltransferase [Micromonospora sp. PPF5-17B]NES36133.1 GNAT family N-acetyltransferase [Micromonospora solifontis]NES56690.1 GNAT family N-acetyltransferase [Micromonospora sp. PPF5-6]RNL99888.1 GNAT family N-acetyltransferase [Micromonospora solifontis]